MRYLGETSCIHELKSNGFCNKTRYPMKKDGLHSLAVVKGNVFVEPMPFLLCEQMSNISTPSPTTSPPSSPLLHSSAKNEEDSGDSLDTPVSLGIHTPSRETVPLKCIFFTMHAPHAKAKHIIANSAEKVVFCPVKDSKILFSTKKVFLSFLNLKT